MTFEEFFKRKKIDLVQLKQSEPGLFSEFKIHYEQMGEKSFDHTKKYWFNKLRLRFPAPVEIKTEKVHIDNPIAEQTITESLIESAAPSPNVGFKPKFRAGVTKPTEATPEVKKETLNTEFSANAEPVSPPSNIGFKPKFRAGVTKPSEPVAPKEELSADGIEEKSESNSPPPTVGFKPRFKAGVTKPAEPEIPKQDLQAAEPEKDIESPLPTPNIGFKPRFKAGITKPVAPEQKDDQKEG